VQQQGVVLRGCAGEVPFAVLGEVLGLGVDTELVVVGHLDRVRRGSPSFDLLRADVEPRYCVRPAVTGVGRGAQVLLGHQVRVEVVVDHGGVLVRPGDPVDPEAGLARELPQGGPQPRRLHQEVYPDRRRELLVAGRGDVADGRVGDVGVDVEPGGAGRPVSRALLAVDRSPRERGSVESELRGPRHRRRQRVVAPGESSPGGLRRGVGEHRERECLCVPEGMTVIPGAGQALGRDGL
jgi:hypothetical protein